MNFLDYLLRIQKAHDIFNIGLDSFINVHMSRNKAGYTATLVACGWAGAVLKKVTRASGQEL